ncbi:MAG: MarR family winged helix-turn-helix transcriptional regulator [Oligosphaeraceae bacterium]
MEQNHLLLIGRIHEMSHRWLTRELSSAGLGGLVPSHGDILACLFLHGEASMNQLAAFAHRTRPTTTILVEKLIRLGYVKRRRSREDGRSVLVALTEQGESIRPVFDDISGRLLSHLLSGLSFREREGLRVCLEKVFRGLEEEERRESHEGDPDHC